MNLKRYDPACSRVAAVVPWSRAAPQRLVPGARYDANWRAPGGGGAPVKAWHWPMQSLPVLLRTFTDVATADPLIATALERARRINAVRTLSMEHARELGARFDSLEMPRVAASGKSLREHQRKAVRAALLAGGSRAIFHQTGTGKTITAGALLSLMVQPRDGLRIGVVVCPLTLILSAWAKDLVEWFPGLPFVDLSAWKKGEPRRMAAATAIERHGRAILLVNYEAVRTDAAVRRCLAGAYVVFDECSKAKDAKSQIGIALRELACVLRGAVLLSGTPAPGGNHEYWNHAKVLAPVVGYDAFPGGHSAFTEEFCRPKRFDKRSDPCIACGAAKWSHDQGRACGAFKGKGHFGGIEFKVDMAARLHERLAPVCEWVKKEECLDLPPKVYVDVPVPLDKTTARVYREMRDAMEVEMLSRYGGGEELRAHAMNALAQRVRLRQITAGFVPAQKDGWLAGDDHVLVPLGREKIDWLIERCEVDAERLVLWTQFIFEAARYAKDLEAAKVSCATITGETPKAARAEVFDAFVRGDFQVLIAHPGVAQWGVSFPGVSQAAYGSLSYQLQEYQQSQDRIHGIGRGDPNKRSTFYRLVATADGEPTVDQEMVDILEGKYSALDLVFRIDRERRTNGFVPKDLGAHIDAA